jgi:hypothetical protein
VQEDTWVNSRVAVTSARLLAQLLGLARHELEPPHPAGAVEHEI